MSKAGNVLPYQSQGKSKPAEDPATMCPKRLDRKYCSLAAETNAMEVNCKVHRSSLFQMVAPTIVENELAKHLEHRQGARQMKADVLKPNSSSRSVVFKKHYLTRKKNR